MPWTSEQLAAIVALVAFRALPFVGFYTVSKAVSPARKAAVLAIFGAVVAAVFVTSAPAILRPLLALPLVYAYLFAAALLLPSVEKLVTRGWLAKVPLCVLLLGVYVVLLGALAPRWMVLPFLILGWDSALKAFSYSADHQSLRTPLSRRELLFFMLVSPTLVLAERGFQYGPPLQDRGGLARLSLGVATFLAEDLLRSSAWLLPAGTLRTIAVPVAHGVAYYFGHSGLASLQIGLMRLAGYQVPERYVYPTLATNPVDFWRRWNTWVGSWARRYVFSPASIHLRRNVRGLSPLVARGLAAIAAFAAIGALHDVLRIAEELQTSGAVSLAATAMFVMFGASTVLWAGVTRALRAVRSEGKAPRTGAGARGVTFGGVVSYSVFVPCALGMYWLAQSTLAGAGLPAPLPALIWR